MNSTFLQSDMENRQSQTFHQAKDHLNAALEPYGLHVDCAEPWHTRIWDLYVKKEGGRYVLVSTRQEADARGWLERVLPATQDKRASFQWDTTAEKIIEWAKANHVIEAD